MSYGITPYDFVQQVYYQQEKVILDFWPTDDKYKEVLMEANMVLQELQKEEDWSWLRDRVILGHCNSDHHHIPEFTLDESVYKPSTLHGDCVMLYRHHHGHLCEYDYIEVPFASNGILSHRERKEFGWPVTTNVMNNKLYAIILGNTITFNRLLTYNESHRIAVIDVQRRIKPIHICNDDCVDEDGNIPDYEHGKPCKLIEPVLFTEIPDPNYMVVRTAALHAEGSPTAQGRIAGLQDNAQKLLSAMRQNDASKTEPDFIDWDTPHYFNVW